jgi:hypothetical protein
MKKLQESAMVKTLARLGHHLFLVGSIFLGAAAFFFFWKGPLPLESVIQRLAALDVISQYRTLEPEGYRLGMDLSTIRKYYGLSVAASLSFTGVILLLAAVWRRLDEKGQALAWRLMATLACSGALVVYVMNSQYEGAWMPISVAMSNPASLPIFGHRLLFVWIADGFHAAIPGLSYLRSYYLSQSLASVLAIYALGRWSALFVGESLSWLGQVCGVVLISTSFNYRNFYDIGIVLFTTWGLTALYRRQYFWLVPIVAVGTLNYEGVLLIILVAVFVVLEEKPGEPVQAWLPYVIAALLLHVLIRVALAKQMPMRNQDWRVWSNMVKPFVNPREIVRCALTLAGWYALAVAGFRFCDERLKTMSVLFPLLAGVTFLFGQFHEARQFDAFIPILIAILLSATVRRFETEYDPSGILRAERTPHDTR